MKRAAIIIVIAIIIVALISGLLVAYMNITGYATKSEQKVVRIGYILSDHHATFFVAKEKNLYENQGIRVEEKVFSYGVPLIEALSTGNIDIGYVGITPAIIGKANDYPVTIIAAVQNEGSGIAVNKELYEKGIDSIEKLKGKKIAHPGIGSVQYILLLKELEKANLTKDDVYLKIVDPPEMQMALENGEIDGFIIWQPWLTKAKNDGVAEIIETSGEMWPDHPCCVLVANEKFLENNKALVKKIVNIHKEATDFVNINRTEAVRITAKKLGIDEKTEQESMNSMKFSIYPNITAIDEFSDIMYNMSIIRVKPDVNDFVKLEFLG